MNKCHVIDDLSSYLDNELSESRKIEVEAHLKECSSCMQELGRLKTLSEKLKSWQEPSLGPFFENTVKERIASRGQEGGRVKMKNKTIAILVPSGVLAGVLVFVFAGVLMQRGAYKSESKMRDDKVKVINALRAGESRFAYSTNENKDGDYLTEGFAKEPETRFISKMDSGSRDDGTLWRASGGALSSSSGIADTYSVRPTASSDGSVIVIQPTIPATAEGQMVIRTADVRLEVEDGKATYQKASAICQELGGYLSASNFYKDGEGRESGTITMRIPKDKFLIALDKLGALGKVENIASNSQDVGQEYANLKTQLDAAMIVYNKTLEALQKRQTTVDQAMRLESELTPILRRVQDLKNKIEYLNNMVSFTTITVNFHEPLVSAKVLQESKKYIKESLLTAKINAVKLLAKALPNLAVLIVVAVIGIGGLLALVFWLKKILRRKE